MLEYLHKMSSIDLVDFDFNLTMISIYIATKHARITTTTFHAHVHWGKQRFIYHSVSEWNSLPIELKQSTNLN